MPGLHCLIHLRELCKLQSFHSEIEENRTVNFLHGLTVTNYMEEVKEE